jgi:gas vesicle protein
LIAERKMNENSSSELGAFLAGFVIGGLVGAAAALVLAPQSGSETRSQIINRSQDLRDAGSERVHQMRDSADEYLNQSPLVGEDEGFDAQEQARIILDSGRQTTEYVVSDEVQGTEDENDAPAVG